ncbi:MAG: segregation/condensation protein A [Clostridium sp.]|jgi:segregation and condensation protein A|nr:segregation/condensation protein A [Clostridium sp.]
MAIPVKLEVFEGPLDLLLHLIDKNKIDIYDIPIVLITEQYLDYVRQLSVRDMDTMSEFMVMAATLLDIKCRLLLPKEVSAEGEEDPRTELVEKLLEYKLYKYMSLELRDRQIDAQRNLYRDRRLPEEVAAYRRPLDYGELIGDMTPGKLRVLFTFVLKKQKDKVDPIRSGYGNIEKEEVDMEAKALFVENYVRERQNVSFRQLFSRQAGKMEIIVTFLIVLEMIKLGKISIFQETIFDDILITLNDHSIKDEKEAWNEPKQRQ